MENLLTPGFMSRQQGFSVAPALLRWPDFGPWYYLCVAWL